MLYGCTAASRLTCSFSEVNGHSAVKESLHNFQNPIIKPEQQLSCRLDNQTIVVQFPEEKMPTLVLWPIQPPTPQIKWSGCEDDHSLRSSSALQYIQLHLQSVGRDNSVSIVTHYGLDGPGIES